MPIFSTAYLLHNDNAENVEICVFRGKIIKQMFCTVCETVVAIGLGFWILILNSVDLTTSDRGFYLLLFGSKFKAMFLGSKSKS